MFLIKLSQRCVISHLYIFIIHAYERQGENDVTNETAQVGDRYNTDFICYSVRQSRCRECNYAAQTGEAGSEMTV